MRSETIIAVDDVEKSSAWYQQLLGCRSTHGGPWFDRLVGDDGEVLLLLGRWGSETRPSMKARPETAPGRGVGLTVRTTSDDQLRDVRARAGEMGADVLRELAFFELAHHDEFVVADPDGYVLTVCGPMKDA